MSPATAPGPSPDSAIPVAIVGGGLCGLALSIALHNRSIPYRIYEARASFTELGAGINLGPNTLKSFELIDQSLGEAILKICTRNLPPHEDVWMQVRLGAPADQFGDGDLLAELMSPPTGSMTVRRNDLLAILAERAGPEHASFNKKLVGLEERREEQHVALKFSDGTEDYASIVVGCDGIHSAVRRCLLRGDDGGGGENPAAAAIPQFSECGVYRAVIATETMARAVGPEIARTSSVFLGPNGYVVFYPVEGGKSVNVGFWPLRKGSSWTRRSDWVLPDQRAEMRREFAHWGPTVHKIMDVMGNPSFFATHHHSVQPDSCFRGRVCLIGDAAHSMPPHQGAGASQAMEDAYVLSEVLGLVNSSSARRPLSPGEIHAAFEAHEAVRKPRSQKILADSVSGMAFWCDVYRSDLDHDRIREFVREAYERLQWIWHDDIAGQAERARRRFLQNRSAQ